MPRLLATALGLVAVAALAFAATPASAMGSPKENAQDTRIQDLRARADALLALHPKLVFNTAGTFTGDLITEAFDLGLGTFTGDGLGAADAICQDEADTAAPPLGGRIQGVAAYRRRHQYRRQVHRKYFFLRASGRDAYRG